MYTCKDSIGRLLDFLDGDISPEEERHLHEHLGECPPCVDFFRTYRATPKLARRAYAEERMPTEMATRLVDFLKVKCCKDEK